MLTLGWVPVLQQLNSHNTALLVLPLCDISDSASHPVIGSFAEPERQNQ
jgi:hypothetical protein